MPRLPRCVFLGADLRGSVRAAYGADGTPACWFGDDVFGEPLDAQTGGDAALVQRLTRRYAGHAFETESGLYDYGARRYDPALARFTAPDPQHETPDPYAYCGNDPVDHIDPDGRGRTLVIVMTIRNNRGLLGPPVMIVFDDRGAYGGHVFESDLFKHHDKSSKWRRDAISEFLTSLRFNLTISTLRDLVPDIEDMRDVRPKTRTSVFHLEGTKKLMRKPTTNHIYAFTLGRKSRTLNHYLEQVGYERGQWSALSLTKAEIEAAVAFDETEFDPTKNGPALRTLWTLRDYVGVEYRSRFAAHAKAVGNPDADLYYREGLLQAWTSWSEHLGEQLVRTQTPDPNATDPERLNAPHSSDSSSSSDDHGQYRRGPSRRDEDDEDDDRSGRFLSNASRWDSTKGGWTDKPLYYGNDD